MWDIFQEHHGEPNFHHQPLFWQPVEVSTSFAPGQDTQQFQIGHRHDEDKGIVGRQILQLVSVKKCRAQGAQNQDGPNACRQTQKAQQEKSDDTVCVGVDAA